MAEFRCRSCGKEGSWVNGPDRFTCPLYDAMDVQFVVYKHEMTDDYRAAKRMGELSAQARVSIA
jgi:hypothetical protein